MRSENSRCRTSLLIAATMLTAYPTSELAQDLDAEDVQQPVAIRNPAVTNKEAYVEDVAREVIRNTPLYEGVERCTTTNGIPVDMLFRLRSTPCSQVITFRVVPLKLYIDGPRDYKMRMRAAIKDAIQFLGLSSRDIQYVDSFSASNVGFAVEGASIHSDTELSTDDVDKAFPFGVYVAPPDPRTILSKRVIPFFERKRLAGHVGLFDGYNIVDQQGRIVNTRCSLVMTADGRLTREQLAQCFFRAHGIYKEVDCAETNPGDSLWQSLLCIRRKGEGIDFEKGVSAFDQKLMEMRRRQ